MLMLLLLMGGAACENWEPTAPSSLSVTDPIRLAAPNVTLDRPDEAEFVSLATAIPSFAGYFLDATGQVVVQMTKTEDFGKGVGTVQHRFASHRDAGLRMLSRRPMVARQARYTFAELSAWRDLVYEHILGMPGVAFDDVDEARNRVTIGLPDDPTLRQKVMVITKALGIPTDAINFELARRSTPMGSAIHAATDPGGSIAGTYSTVGGGYQINHTGGFNCTATVAADFASTRVLLGASHCSISRYALDNGDITNPVIGAVMGTESSDPTPTSSFCQWDPWYSCYPARGSDAALYTMNGTMPTVRGGIARLTSSQRDPNVPNLTVATDYPWFYVTSVAYTHVVGEQVQKVGAETGWTYGWI
ncbi:MAG: hypothetical protein H0W68_10340, partial [Gemmatimonadaceae bacterium]|nr:hypothetical protein [Gemmatimonadaceae bacterium]